MLHTVTNTMINTSYFFINEHLDNQSLCIFRKWKILSNLQFIPMHINVCLSICLSYKFFLYHSIYTFSKYKLTDSLNVDKWKTTCIDLSIYKIILNEDILDYVSKCVEWDKTISSSDTFFILVSNLTFVGVVILGDSFSTNVFRKLHL